MRDRGLAAYIAELLGTLFLVFIIGVVLTLFVSTSPASQTGSDFAVVGLTQAFVLFGLIITFGAVSGGHFNPAVTLAAALLRRINVIDAIVYMLAQLSGAVIGALMVKGLLLDEGEPGGYGTPHVSELLGGNLQGAMVEAVGAFLLVLVVCAVALNPRGRQEWAPLAVGATLGSAVMALGALTGGSFNPARWFGPALVSGDIDADALIPYVVGPLVAGLIAALIYRFVIAGPQFATGPEAPTSEAASVGRAIKDAEVRERNL